jgi:hypothetical protein
MLVGLTNLTNLDSLPGIVICQRCLQPRNNSLCSSALTREPRSLHYVYPESACGYSRALHRARGSCCQLYAFASHASHELNGRLQNPPWYIVMFERTPQLYNETQSNFSAEICSVNMYCGDSPYPRLQYQHALQLFDIRFCAQESHAARSNAKYAQPYADEFRGSMLSD